MTVTHIRALRTSDPRVADVLAQAELAFVSVGGPNLLAVAATLAPGLAARRAAGGQLLNIVCCENWHRPAEVLRRGLGGHLTGADAAYLAEPGGIPEPPVLPSGIAPP